MVFHLRGITQVYYQHKEQKFKINLTKINLEF